MVLSVHTIEDEKSSSFGFKGSLSAFYNVTQKDINASV